MLKTHGKIKAETLFQTSRMLYNGIVRTDGKLFIIKKMR